MSDMPVTNQSHVPGVVYFGCHCGATMPQSEADQHQCAPIEFSGDPHLAAFQRRELERIKAQRAAEVEAMNAPRPCDDCGTSITPGSVHWCEPPPDAAWAAVQANNTAGLVKLLKSQGFTVDKPA